MKSIFLHLKHEIMSSRFVMGKVLPDAYRALLALESFTRSSGIPVLHQEMIRIRASQINGCAYCVNAHTKEARKHGESEQRVYLMSVWKEAPNIFNEEEQLLLEMTEEVTLIHQHGLSDKLYEKAIKLWGEQYTAQVMMAIIHINSLNRIGVGLHLHPDT
jgi:AhpD family alkylhydroperoxidase